MTNVTGGTLTVTGTNQTSGYAVASGATLSTNGGTLSLNNGQSLSGSGTVNGNVSLPSGAVLAPGTGIGTLNITGNLLAGMGSITNLELSDLNSFDKLAISGNATLGGILNLSFAPSFPNAFPAAFDFMTAGGTITGMFNQINIVGGLPSGATDYSVMKSSTSTGGQKLSLVIVPEEGTGLLALLGGAAGFGLVGVRTLFKRGRA